MTEFEEWLLTVLLTVVFPNSTHVICLSHIVNLAADVFQKIAEFQHVCTLISMIKSSLFLKPGRKSRFLVYLKDNISPFAVKLPLVPVSTRWNSWFEAAVPCFKGKHLRGILQS